MAEEKEEEGRRRGGRGSEMYEKKAREWRDEERRGEKCEVRGRGREVWYKKKWEEVMEVEGRNEERGKTDEGRQG